jgi:hypothetical protein
MIELENMPIWMVVGIIGLLVFFLLTGAVIAFVYFRNIIWNFKVTIFEDIPPYGNIPIKNDRAKFIKFGDGGEEIYYLRKAKKYRVAHGRLIGKNKIAWAIDPVSKQWYNIGFEALDKKLKQIGVNPVHLDLRYANAALRKGIMNRYDDRSFVEKYGVPITIGMLILAIIIQGGAMWFFMNKLLQVSSTNLEAIKASKEVMLAAKEVISALTNLQGAGSGIKVV